MKGYNSNHRIVNVLFIIRTTNNDRKEVTTMITIVSTLKYLKTSGHNGSDYAYAYVMVIIKI